MIEFLKKGVPKKKKKTYRYNLFYIPVKSWNSEEGTRRIVGVHGWLDNAGSFDKLAPLLPPTVHFVALDLPGHGLSSHLPEGLSYDAYDMVTAVRRVAEYLDWKSF